MFLISFVFLPFLRKLTKSPRRSNPARAGTNPLYIKWVTLCWNYKCCSKRLLAFQNLKELNKSLCSHLSLWLIKIVKTYFSAGRLLFFPPVSIWLLFIFTRQMSAAASWVLEWERTSSIVFFYIASGCAVIFKKHLAEYLCANTKCSQPAAKGLVAVKDQTCQVHGFKHRKQWAILKHRINLLVSLVKIYIWVSNFYFTLVHASLMSEPDKDRSDWAASRRSWLPVLTFELRLGPTCGPGAAGTICPTERCIKLPAMMVLPVWMGRHRQCSNI